MIQFFKHIQQRQFKYTEGACLEQVATHHFPTQSRVLTITRSDKILGL